MTAKHRILSTLIALFFAGCTLGTAIELPWKTPDDLSRSAVDSRIGLCPEGQIVLVKLEKDGTEYLFFYAGDNHRFVLAKMGTDRPVHLYWGRVVAPQAPLEVHGDRPFVDSDMALGPCPLLFPKEAKI